MGNTNLSEQKQENELDLKYKSRYIDINEDTIDEDFKANKFIKENDEDFKVEKFIKEWDKSKQFVDNLNIHSTIEKLSNLGGTKIDKHNLEIVDLTNNEKQKEREKIISNISNNLKQKKINTKEYIDNLSLMGSNLKESIIYESFHEPEKFVPISEALNNDKKSSLFIQGLLAKQLQKNNITTVIKKDPNEKNISSTLLQLITSGDIFKKVYTIEYNYGSKKNAEILTNEKYKEKFISEKKLLFSQKLKIPENKIYIGNIRHGCVLLDMSTDTDASDSEDNGMSKIKNADSDIKNIKYEPLIKGCMLDPSMFDPAGDRSEGWGQGEKRGPPNYLKDYIPPLGWDGYGLKVTGMYDNGDDTWLGYSNVEGEWYIAYHGTGGNDVIKKIIVGGFKAGGRQACEEYDNLNPLSIKDYKKCGKGVYCTPQINVADYYSSKKKGINYKGKNYHLVFMCRVNPYKVRFASSGSDAYWIVSGGKIGDSNSKKYDDEIRPYRILLKEV